MKGLKISVQIDVEPTEYGQPSSTTRVVRTVPGTFGDAGVFDALDTAIDNAADEARRSYSAFGEARAEEREAEVTS